MPLLIGTDEAGYGPNLGPLVITATSWNIPHNVHPDTLWKCLDDVVTNNPSKGDKRLHVGDSKQVYSAGKSIAPLEKSVHAFLRLLNNEPHSVGTLGRLIAGPEFTPQYDALCGNVVGEQHLPTACSREECETARSALAAELNSNDIQLLSIKSRIIFPAEFNSAVEACGSKGKVLSAATLQLVRDSVDSTGVASDGWIYCDKHGGRNRYDELISEAFEDQFVFRLEESNSNSRYRVGDLEFCFRTKAEELLPVALSSMVSKYLREMVMMQFNRFWQHHISDLKPTKGYPVDAKRFWEQIEAKVEALGLNKCDIWRVR